jgi:hypothetical protein
VIKTQKVYKFFIYIVLSIGLFSSGNSQDLNNEIKTLSTESTTIALVVRQNGMFVVEKFIKGAQDRSFEYSLKEFKLETHTSDKGLLFVYKNLKTVSYSKGCNMFKAFQFFPIQDAKVDKKNGNENRFLILNKNRIVLSSAIELISNVSKESAPANKK